jgi:membrane protein
MIEKIKHFSGILKNLFKEFGSSDPMIYASSIAFFTIFAMPAILVLIINTTGNLFGEEAITGELASHVEAMIGKESAVQVQNIVKNASLSQSGFIATIISIVTLIISSTTVFNLLQRAINKIWHVKPQPRREWLKILKDRGISFIIVIGLGALLAISLTFDTIIAAFSGFIAEIETGFSAGLVWLLNFILSFGLLTLVFAILFKVLPDANVRWKDVWVGSVITALLFAGSKFAIGLIIGNSTVTTAYGAAGSVIVILVWVYFSTIILLLGAEITQVYAREIGRQIKPSGHAIRTGNPDDYIANKHRKKKASV